MFTNLNIFRYRSMKFFNRSLLAFVFVAPLALRADPTTDQKIEDAAASSYNFRTVLEKQVNVDAQDGVITLTGTVLDKDQKALAEETVRALPGVVEIKNQLEVSSPGPERSDGWIALKIRSVLLLRSNVSATNTDVSVRDGNVILNGTADTAAQRELTETYARGVEGVKSVQNKLVVREPGTNGQLAEAASAEEEKIDDTSITAQVKYALMSHRSIGALKASVETQDGVVAIRGRATTQGEKELVSQLASSVRGVSAVENSMTVSVAE